MLRPHVPMRDKPAALLSDGETGERKMKHPSNSGLFAYWNAQRGDRLAPERSDIEPGAIRKLLGDTFVLEADRFGLYPFRLAGTRLCALFGRELKGESFVRLWERAGQASMRELIAVVMEEKTGVVARATATTSDDTLLPITLELLLLPLAYDARAEARVLGAMAPLSAPYWLGARAVGSLELGMFRHVGAGIEGAPAPQIRAAVGKLAHGWTVYDGGRTD
jgi:hypothetical protein